MMRAHEYPHHDHPLRHSQLRHGEEARAWLAGRAWPTSSTTSRSRGVPERLSAWMAAVGWDRLLNRQGTSWRRLDAAVQSSGQDAASAAALMREHASVIKRPVVEWNGTATGRVTVGFKPETWNELLAAGSKT